MIPIFHLNSIKKIFSAHDLTIIHEESDNASALPRTMPLHLPTTLIPLPMPMTMPLPLPTTIH